MYGASWTCRGDGFNDPEAAHENRLAYSVFKAKQQFKVLFRYRIVRMYAFLALGFISVHLINIILPTHAHVHIDNDDNDDVAHLGTHLLAYTNLQHAIPYKTILQSPNLVSKLNRRTTIEQVIYPQASEMTIESIQFKKGFKQTQERTATNARRTSIYVHSRTCSWYTLQYIS